MPDGILTAVAQLESDFGGHCRRYFQIVRAWNLVGELEQVLEAGEKVGSPGLGLLAVVEKLRCSTAVGRLGMMWGTEGARCLGPIPVR